MWFTDVLTESFTSTTSSCVRRRVYVVVCTGVLYIVHIVVYLLNPEHACAAVNMHTADCDKNVTRWNTFVIVDVKMCCVLYSHQRCFVLEVMGQTCG